MKTIEVTAGVIYNAQRRILIAKRKQGKSLGGKWEFPGGKIEIDESPEQCLKRELLEELGISVNNIIPLIETEHDYGEFAVLLKSYECAILDGEITLNDHDQIAWVTKDELKSIDFSPADLPIVRYLELTAFDF